MGEIRGRHISPGIYTRLTDISYGREYKNRGLLYKSSDYTGGGGGGGGKPTPPVVKDWVFGNTFPITFS